MIQNFFAETTRLASRRFAGGYNMTTECQFRELEVQIARYRFLEREVTDPLAACLLHSIVLELEADLQKGVTRSVGGQGN